MNMPPGLVDYAELQCCSSFTFLRGASQPEELVTQACRLGYRALALTDECSFAGSVRAHRAAKAQGLHLIHGAEFRCVDGLQLILLVQDRAGWGNLSALITLARRRSAKGEYALLRGDLEAISPAGAVPGCLALWLPGEEIVAADAHWLAARFSGRVWIAHRRRGRPDEAARLHTLRRLGEAAGLPLVAAGAVDMHVRARRPLRDVLCALRLNTSVAEAGLALPPNAEGALRSRLRLARLFPPDLLAETLSIAARCRFSLDELRYEYPQEVVPPGHTPASFLRQEVFAGLARRYPLQGAPAAVLTQIEAELALVAELGYEAYFLTVYDIVCFARSQKILCQGRGSAANSALCFALGITEVDPAQSRLLFGRFLSRERGEPPDIDVDFEHERREEVIQYIYRRYGRDRAALAASLITYRTRSALRDVGRALGFGQAQIDALTRSLAWWDQREQWPARLAALGLDPQAPRVRQWLALADELRGFPRHLSQHVGGFVISRGPLARLVPVENAAMAERTVIQWDKDDLETLGLLKVDVLALGMLSAIRRALEGVAATLGRPFAMQDIPREDAATYRMIQCADTIGVFQIESRAQMSMLPRLKPACFYDLVIEVAIVRPGPIQGDMVHPYLRRRQGLDPVSYPSEAVRGVLARTLGVPIFQEQAMELAMVAAGFTAGEADELRRAMAAWKKRGGIGHFEDKLIDGMLARGYTEDFARALFRQLRGFGDYGFPESHAASFALLVYVSAWLKCHHPAAFCCALLNSQPMGFYAPAQLLRDAREHGVRLLAVDVQASEWGSSLDFTSPGAPALRLGLREIDGLDAASAARIVAARAAGAFADVDDLAARAGLEAATLQRLAHAGALAALAGHRREAAWAASVQRVQGDLFAGLAAVEPDAALAAPGEGEELVADYATLGFSLGRHPLALLRDRLESRRFVPIQSARSLGDRALARVAGIVTGRQRPGTASGVVFVTLEDESGVLNVVVWPALVERQRRELLGARLLGVYGQVQREGEVLHLVASRLVDLTPWLGELQTASRDFH